MDGLSTVVALARRITRNEGTSLEEKLPAAFAVRSRISSIPYVSSSRTHLAPNYVSDLGIRRTDDPEQFLNGCLSQLGVSTTDHLTSWTVKPLMAAWADDSISELEYAAHIDALISYAGMWDQAADLAARTLDQNRRPQSQRLLTYLGSAFAAAGDKRAGDMFVAAESADDATPATQAMARIRLAAWQIKRLGDVTGGIETLESLEVQIHGWASGFEISAGDENALMGVSLNLKALSSVKLKDIPRAAELLEESLDRLDTDGLVVVGEDEKRRYYAQVCINISQLHCQAGAFEMAAEVSERHVAWTRDNHPGSVSEALTVSGYVEYLCGRHLLASSLLREAARRIAVEGSPIRLLVARKALAATLHQSGDEDGAQQILETMLEDPLGLTLIAEAI